MDVNALGEFRLNWLEYARKQTPKGSSEAITVLEMFRTFSEMVNKGDIIRLFPESNAMDTPPELEYIQFDQFVDLMYNE